MDINWHSSKDLDFNHLLIHYKGERIIIESDLGMRITNTKFFKPLSGKFAEVNEEIIKFAFLDR